MQTLSDLTRVRRLLCIGAHSDDLEIGCGATLLRLLRENPNVHVTWCIFAAAGERGEEARRAATRLLCDAAEVRLVCHSFGDAHFPGEWMAVKKAMASLSDAKPDVIFTHRTDDAHQDHRLLGEMTAQTFRNHLVLAYEIPKHDGDLGQPNVYAPASEADLEMKCRVLTEFRSQRDRHWFDDDTFRGLARLRGLECASPTRFAEAFYCRKWVI